jgi:ATP-dependent DNA helicase RecG
MKKEENQHIEFKENWRDEYVKWICGFANSNGGKLYIGINDKGIVSGITNARQLAEEIPNKTRDLLGIIVDVNIKKKLAKQYLEIIVEDYPFPISYKGQYHYRSGSTKQELKGAALDKFILRKQGKHWDSVPVPNVKLKDLNKNLINQFKKIAVQVSKLSAKILHEDNAITFQNLGLYDGKYLNRTAALFFYDNPQRLVTGAYIKIGYFKSDDELLFQDEVTGTLYEQVDGAMNLLLTKYLKATITYLGINRKEKYPYPELALREALLNAVAHKDYSSANPIQISVYNDKIIFYNAGELPANWTVNQLLKKHPSIPFNPLISKLFFCYGLIEAWGRGTIKIMKECSIYGILEPIFLNDEAGLTIKFTSKRDTDRDTDRDTNRDTDRDTNRDTDRDTNYILMEDFLIRTKIINLIKNDKDISINTLVLHTGKSKSTVLRYIAKLKNDGNLIREGNTRVGYWKVTRKKIQ